jgi:hypothetical protein
MANMDQILRENAAQVLKNNWKDGFTIPCEGLYPFQWNWDSGFIALGWMHIDLDRAFQEIHSLLKGQWSNGFLPHIIFHNPSDTYFPGPEVQASHLSAFAPELPTSGITQPPVLGWVLGEMYAFAKADSRTLPFLHKVYDAAYKAHEYLYTHRDPNQEGLVYICHNWEAGTDNTPVWDSIWETMDSPEYKLERKDNLHIAASHRPSNREYQHYIHLIELFKSWKYDDVLIAKKSPFLVQDPLFNAMLIASNEALITIGEQLGKIKEVAQLKDWNILSKKSYQDKLYDTTLEGYIYYDLRNERPLRHLSSSSFAGLFAGIPSKEIAERIVSHLDKGRFSGKKDELLLCASFDPESSLFDAQRYWRGPIWINLNWLIYRGLKKYELHEIAQKVKDDTLYLMKTHGFYEYFDPRKAVDATLSEGYGGANFSWSAALTINLLES